MALLHILLFCVNVNSGVNFINILWATFTPADPKSAKKTVKLSIFFALLGSALAKAAHRMLMKLTLGVRFFAAFCIGSCRPKINTFSSQYSTKMHGFGLAKLYYILLMREYSLNCFKKWCLLASKVVMSDWKIILSLC